VLRLVKGTVAIFFGSVVVPFLLSVGWFLLVLMPVWAKLILACLLLVFSYVRDERCPIRPPYRPQGALRDGVAVFRHRTSPLWGVGFPWLGGFPTCILRIAFSVKKTPFGTGQVMPTCCLPETMVSPFILAELFLFRKVHLPHLYSPCWF